MLSLNDELAKIEAEKNKRVMPTPKKYESSCAYLARVLSQPPEVEEKKIENPGPVITGSAGFNAAWKTTSTMSSLEQDTNNLFRAYLGCQAGLLHAGHGVHISNPDKHPASIEEERSDIRFGG